MLRAKRESIGGMWPKFVLASLEDAGLIKKVSVHWCKSVQQANALVKGSHHSCLLTWPLGFIPMHSFLWVGSEENFQMQLLVIWHPPREGTAFALSCSSANKRSGTNALLHKKFNVTRTFPTIVGTLFACTTDAAGWRARRVRRNLGFQLWNYCMTPGTDQGSDHWLSGFSFVLPGSVAMGPMMKLFSRLLAM